MLEDKTMTLFGARIKGISKRKKRVNIIALGDVGSTMLLGLKLLGGRDIENIGIFDLSEKTLLRYEMEMNQIASFENDYMPKVKPILNERDLYDCDVLAFCASKSVPDVESTENKNLKDTAAVSVDTDVRMQQLEGNRPLVRYYAKRGVELGFEGMFLVVSDPVDQLAKEAVDAGLGETNVRGMGLGVMYARCLYYASKSGRRAEFLKEGRVFGPHGKDLVVLNSIQKYDAGISHELQRLAVNSNMVTRKLGFKPYIAPAVSSAAMSMIAMMQGRWHYGSIFFGKGFLGCLSRLTEKGIQVENIPLEQEVYEEVIRAYEGVS